MPVQFGDFGIQVLNLARRSTRYWFGLNLRVDREYMEHREHDTRHNLHLNHRAIPSVNRPDAQRSDRLGKPGDFNDSNDSAGFDDCGGFRTGLLQRCDASSVGR